MAITKQMREQLEEFGRAQARPITDAALVERMRSEATTWINATHAQHRRITQAPVDRSEPDARVWLQEIDLHFLLVALTRLRRAVALASSVADLRDELTQRLAAFDARLPALGIQRNVAEHFDDYTVDRGRRSEIKRSQLQVWSLGEDDDQLVWRWLDVDLPVDDAHDAARTLYAGFLSAVESYVASRSAATALRS